MNRLNLSFKRCFHAPECIANQYSKESTTCALITTTGNGTKQFTSGDFSRLYVNRKYLYAVKLVY